jgi:hypothetical protein
MRRSSRQKLRRVLLDDSFVNALLATDSAEHVDACAVYGELIDNYEHGVDRLFALSTVLGDVPREFRRSALAPVDTVHVAAQHRSAARALNAPATPRAALSLVMMRRERIGTVATATREFDPFDVEILSIAPRIENGFEAPVPEGYRAYEPARLDTSVYGPAAVEPAVFEPPSADSISSGTAPLPVPLSTDE